MSTHIEETNTHRIISDDFSGRVFSQEVKCSVCKEWIDHEEIVWANDNGELNTDTGKPFCVNCLPEESENS